LTLAETLPDPSTPCPVEEAIRHSDREFLERLLTQLTSAQRMVIRLRFGLDDGCARTLEEVAQLVGYVRQGIHRIETAALLKLRQHARFDRMKNLPGMARAEYLTGFGVSPAKGSPPDRAGCKGVGASRCDALIAKS
jgi:hypothetical protein